MSAATATVATDGRVGRLADLIVEELTGTAAGHCVRVNYLDRAEAAAVCAALAARPAGDHPAIRAYLLGSARDAADDARTITTDRAIELRNRKRDRLCLFVPADLVDATVSSLGNSFAELDGRDLHRRALARATGDLSPAARDVVRRVGGALGPGLRAGDDELLGLALAAAAREARGELETLGLELWRVGLVADARPDFDRHLSGNRNAVRRLTRPQRLDAPARDRIASLKVRPETARELERFFARRPLHDARRWSRELAAGEGPTFDRWQFVESATPSDLTAVTVLPFLDKEGAVLKTAKSLRQPHGPGTPLLAHVGEKEAISAKWVSDPVKPANVHSWLVALVPSGRDDEDGVGFELPSREVKGTARTGRLKLNLELDEAPEFPFCVRVVALDETGNEVADTNGEPIAAVSDPFYLATETIEPPQGTAPRRKTVPTLAEGRLHAALEVAGDRIELGQPLWSEAREATYFSLRANERVILSIGCSPLMLDLEKRTLGEPQAGGRWTLELDEVEPATLDAIVPAPAIAHKDGVWSDFWRARANLFDRLRRAEPRDAVEAVDWAGELAEPGLRYAKAYAALLAAAPRATLLDALSVDTLLLRLNQGETAEEAAVVLPTHPLRVAWLVAHATLLRHWETQLLGEAKSRRRTLVDLDLVRDLTPINMPAFVHAWAEGRPFVFFQNLGFFHGVAVPAGTPDPLRRFLDVARVLGFGDEPGEVDDRRPERLARHLREFVRIHPYADPLRVTLVNPDQGQFLAAALDEMVRANLPKPASAEDEEEKEPPLVPALDVTAYVLEQDEHTATLSGLDRLRGRQVERRTRRPSDHLQPALATAIRPLRAFANGAEPAAGRLTSTHLAVVSDLSQPALAAVPDAPAESGIGSLSLYGLIARFGSAFQSGADGARWQYRVVSDSAVKLEAHPAGPRFSDTLIELQAALLRAGGRLMGEEGATPGLEVCLDRERVHLLDRLHAETDWVVTVDRFFGVDYYDSPNDEALGGVARRYLLDYSPEFTEGLGHRMIVTTAWRDEVALILRRAMDELGFSAVESSVGRLLHYLKTVSGRLALQALRPDSGGAEAVSLAAVMAWLQAKRRLDQAVLVPIDAHPDLFGVSRRGQIEPGQRRCDLLLVALRRGIVDATFIEVKWRRGPLGDLTELVHDMDMQMQPTGNVVQDRFFGPERVDGALQRSYLANVLRFYGARARRYGLLGEGAATSFFQYLAQLERAGLDFRPSYEGFIVSLEDPGRRPIVHDNLTVHVLTARDFEAVTAELVPERSAATNGHAAPADVPAPAAPEIATPPTGGAQPAPSATSGDAGGKAPVPMAPTRPTGIAEETAPDERATDAVAVVLGRSTGGDVTWLPSVQGSPHLFITGIPGQGKSVTILRLLTELAGQGVPALVFDFHGPLADPAGPYARRGRPVCIDAAAGLPFSPFECTSDNSPLGWNSTALTIAEIFDYVCGLGEIQRDALFTCVRDAYKSRGFGAKDGLAGDEALELPTLAEVQRRIEQAERQKRVRNLVPRCRPLLEMEIFQPAADARTAFAEALRQGVVVDLHRLGAETLQLAASAFLLRKVYRDMFQWGPADRLRLAIVLDEAHRLAKDVTLPKIMKEGRKYGVAVVVASQGLADFHPEVLNNAGTKIAFRTNYPDSRKVAGFFRARAGYDLAAQLENLGVGHALAQTPEMPLAARVEMRPPEG